MAGKKTFQGCFAGCLMDCYYFGCLDTQKCEQFKRFEHGEKIDAFGNIVEPAEGYPEKL